MLCEKCQKKEANVFFTEVVDKQIQKHCLCESCSSKIPQIIENPNLSYSFEKILINFLDFFVSQISKPQKENSSSEECFFCGITFQEFQKHPRFGCANDYEVFKDPLENILQTIHGANTHIGKKTKKVLEKEKNFKKIEDLQKQLNLAVQEERYEDAAVFRDQIALLERQKNGIL